MNRVILLALGMFVLGVDAYIVAGLLPGMQKTFHTSYAVLGQSVMIFTLFYALSGPVFSSLMNKKTTKQGLLISITIFSVANLITALSTQIWILLTSRAIAGLGAGLFSPLSFSAASQLVPENQRGRALGAVLTGMSLGTVIGVPVGLYVSNLFQWQLVFVVISILAIATLLMIHLQLPMLSMCQIPPIKKRMALLKLRQNKKTILVTFLMGLASLGLYTYLAPIIQSAHATIPVSTFLWAWGLGGILGSLAIGHILDRFNHPIHVLMAILLILFISLSAIPFAMHWYYVSLLPFIAWGAMGWSSQAPQQMRLMSVNDKQHGMIALALNSSTNYIGSACGAALGGLLLSYQVSIDYFPLYAALVVCLALMTQFKVMLEARAS